MSAVPNCRTAHSLTGVGVASITVLPTASTGEAAGLVSAATRWARAIPKAAARIPAPAYANVDRPGLLMGVVRSGDPAGWVLL